MKRWMSVVCILCLGLSLSACGSAEQEESSMQPSSSVSSEESSEMPESSLPESSEEESSSEESSSSDAKNLASEEEMASIQTFLRRCSLEGENIPENGADDATLAMAGYLLSVQNAVQLEEGVFGIPKATFEQYIRDYFGYSIRDPEALSSVGSSIYYQDGYYRWYGFGVQGGCSTTVRSAEILEDGRYRVETDADYFELNDSGTRTELGTAKGTYLIEKAPDSPYGYHLISQSFTDLPF